MMNNAEREEEEDKESTSFEYENAVGNSEYEAQ